MPSARTQSEEWFERYLRDHGYTGYETPEPDLGVEKRPDYLIERGGFRAVCEVKEFTSTRVRDQLSAAGGGPIAMAADTTYGPVREAVKRAASQLKPVEPLGHPLVVVLANPLAADVTLDPPEILFALYGDPTVSFLVNEDGPVSEPEIGAGRGGRLARDHAYISAIVTMHRRTLAQDWWQQWTDAYWSSRPDEERRPKNIKMAARVSVPYLAAAREAEETEPIPEGDYVFVRVIETQAARLGTAVPLPEDFLDGPRDERWAAREDGWERITGTGADT